ncbi:MAG: DOMON domain-containing protein [Candidatus Kariarchaeaceae archaeon]
MSNRTFLTLVFVCVLIFPISNQFVMVNGQAPDAFLYFSDLDAITLDGSIGIGEYADTIIVKDLSGDFVNLLSWGHNHTHLAIGMVFESTGWVAIGLGDVGVSMFNADIIMAYVIGSQVTIKDMFGTGLVEPTEDSDSYIQANLVAGIDNSTHTTLELIIPMRSNDSLGKDHNWITNNTYGFFTAFHDTIDDFTTEHTSHSTTLNVEVVSFLAEPREIDIKMNVTTGVIPGNVTLSVEVKRIDDNLPMVGLEINFYRKTLYGRLLYGSAVSDGDGIAQTEISVETSGNVTFIAIYEGSAFIKRGESEKWLIIDPIGETTSEEEFGDLRDTFNDEFLIRHFLLIILYIMLAGLFLMYVSVVFDLGQIFRLRNWSENSIKKEDEQ